MEQIKESLAPFQATTIEVLPNGQPNGQASTQFPVGGDSAFGNGMVNGIMEEDYGKLQMIQALTELGFDRVGR